MSPDWSAKEEPIPYAKLDNPQSLNLYAYVMNNPMTRFDADGHAGGCSGDQAAVCKSILDAMGKGMDAAEAMGKAAQQFAKKAGSYFYATGFKGTGDEIHVGIKGAITLEAGHKEGEEVTRHLNGDKEGKEIKSNFHFKLEIGENHSFGFERTAEGEDSKPKWQFSGGWGGVEGSSGGQVGVEAGFCHGTCSSIEGGIEAGKLVRDFDPHWTPAQQDLQYLLTQPAPWYQQRFGSANSALHRSSPLLVFSLLPVERTKESVRLHYTRGELMRFKWLESKVASKLFLWSVVVCLICFASFFSFAVPSVRNFLNSSPANNALGIVFGALLVLTIPCSLIVSIGMAIFCAFADRSSVGLKVLWFLFFLVTWPLGSIIYFFTVYRGFVKKMRTAGPSMIRSPNVP